MLVLLLMEAVDMLMKTLSNKSMVLMKRNTEEFVAWTTRSLESVQEESGVDMTETVKDDAAE